MDADLKNVKYLILGREEYMSREIKFRAWDKQEKRMCKVISVCPNDDGTAAVQTIWGKFGIVEVVGENYPRRFDLMQFTGLRDKNGKEIYEADWLKDDQGIIYQAKFGKLPLDKSGDCVCTYEAFYAEARDSSTMFKCTEIAEWMEVIGNLYENPNLLTLKEL